MKEMSSTVDLHMHSSASDGSDSPAELAGKVNGAGIRIFALTDHDTLEGARELTAFFRKDASEDLKFIPGIELSSMTDRGLWHILGYCCDPDDRLLGHAIREVAERRSRKTQIRIENLQKNDGIVLTQEEKDWIFSHQSPGRPHIGQVLVKRGLVSSVYEAFATYLNSAHSPVPARTSRIEAALAIDGIHSAGGIVSLAHPLGGEGEPHLPPDQFETHLDELVSLGIDSLECYYSRYTQQEVDYLLECARSRHLLVSGGSDYHGTNKNIPLGRLNAGDIPVRPEQLTILKKIL